MGSSAGTILPIAGTVAGGIFGGPAGAAIGGGLGASLAGGIEGGGEQAQAARRQRQVGREFESKFRRSGVGQQILGLLGLGGAGFEGQALPSPAEQAGAITGLRELGAVRGQQAAERTLRTRLGRAGAGGGLAARALAQQARTGQERLFGVRAQEVGLEAQFGQQRLQQLLGAGQALFPGGQAGAASLLGPRAPTGAGAGLGALGGTLTSLGVLGATGQLDFGGGGGDLLMPEPGTLQGASPGLRGLGSGAIPFSELA